MLQLRCVGFSNGPVQSVIAMIDLKIAPLRIYSTRHTPACPKRHLNKGVILSVKAKDGKLLNAKL